MNSHALSLHVGFMSLSSRLQLQQQPDMNHPQCGVFYLHDELCGVSLSTQAGGSSASLGEVVQDVAVTVCCSSVVPGFSSTVSLLSDCKLTHFTSLQQRQRQQHMLRQTRAALASLVNRLFTAAERAELQDVGYLAEGAFGLRLLDWKYTGLHTQWQMHDSYYFTLTA